MALLYEKSATWRRIVNFTKRSPLYMAAFAGLCIGGPWLLGSSIKDATNPQEEGDLERRLRAKSGVHHEVLARAQKERLQVMLDELKSGGGDKRYSAALNGESLGTHSVGSTRGAVSIKPEADKGVSSSSSSGGK